MVSVVDAVKGGKLEYGVRMESDKILQEWLNAAHQKENLEKDFREHQGDFLVLGDVYQDLAKNVAVGNGDLINLQTFLTHTLSAPQSSAWHKDSSKFLAKVGELISQPNNEKLLGLALASLLCKPLRYCIQAEVKPSVNCWNFHSQTAKVAKNVVTVLVVDSSNPVLAISQVASSILSRGRNIILVPGSGLALLPCVLMAELINKAGIPCSVYSLNPEKLQKLAELDNLELVFSGDHAKALSFRGLNANVELDIEGKRAIVAHETADCDAVVDTCLLSLKTNSRTSPGIYLIVQDLLFEDVNWRLRDRLATSKSGSYLDSLADFSTDSQTEVQSEVSKFLEQTGLETIKVGGATVVFNAQPSMPITQLERLGQTLLVFTYRSFPELINILNNLRGVTELSLWLEQQSLAWHIVNQVQIRRISLNALSVNEPIAKELLTVQRGKPNVRQAADVKANASLYASIDGLRAAQRTWMAQTGKAAKLNKLIQLLILEAPFAAYADTLRETEKSVSNVRGALIESADKSLMRFELADSLGAIAIISDNSCLPSALIRLVMRSLSAGNAVVLSIGSELNALAQSLVKAARSAGLPDLVLVCGSNAENHSAIMKHHGIRHLVIMGAVELPVPIGSHVSGVWQTEIDSNDMDELLDFVSSRKHVTMAIGDGLGN